MTDFTVVKIFRNITDFSLVKDQGHRDNAIFEDAMNIKGSDITVITDSSLMGQA
jgi:hypothetical protein